MAAAPESPASLVSPGLRLMSDNDGVTTEGGEETGLGKLGGGHLGQGLETINEDTTSFTG